ncbi:hypothetical protein AURDEDRAFT_18278, partial [Auricularia subglabra TFB-10046 SS5]
PSFPDSEWANVLQGKYVEFDRLFKNVDIVTKGGRTTTTRTVNDSADWHAAWEMYFAAVQFVFRHRTSELQAYGRYINALFVARAKTVEAQRGVIDFDRAIRMLVANRDDLLLTDFN